MARESEISILVRVRDAATQALKQIGPAGVRAATMAKTAFASMGRTVALVARGIRTTLGGVFDWLRSKIFGLPGLLTAIASGATAAMIKQWVDLASVVEQVEARFNVLFSDVRERAQEMAQAITTGMRRNLSDIQDMMAAFEGMLQPMGIASDTSLRLSDALARLAVDFASFAGIADTEALQAIQQGLLGRGMELKRYGIVLDETRIKEEAYRAGLARTGDELTEAQHALAAVSVIQKDATAIMGAAARNSDKYAERVKALKSEINDLQEAFGARMIRVLNQAMDRLGGTQRIVEFTKIAFTFIAGAAEIFIDRLVRLGRWLIAVVEQLGGTAKAIELVDQSVRGLGSTVDAVWQLARITFLGFVTGIDTIVIAVKGLGALLVTNLYLGILQVARAWGFWKSGAQVALDVIDAIHERVFQVLKPALVGIVIAIGEVVRMLAGLARGFRLDVIGVQAEAAARAVEAIGVKLQALEAPTTVTRPIRDFVEEIDAAIAEAERFSTAWASVVTRDLGRDWQAYLERIGAGSQALSDAWRKFMAAGGAAVRDAQDVWTRLAEAMRAASRRAGETAGKSAALSWWAAMATTLAQRAAESETARRLREALDAAGARAQGPSRPRPYEPPKPAGLGVLPGVAGIQAAVQLLDRGRSVMAGFADGWRALTVGVTAADRAFAQWRIGAEGAQQIYQALTDSVSNLLVEMAEGGKNIGKVWDQVKRQVLLAIAQMIAKMLAMKATQALLGFFGFGGQVDFAGNPVSGGPSGVRALGGYGPAVRQAYPVRRAAVGGVTDGPTWMLAGEGRYKREAYVPLPDGRSIPAIVSEPGGSPVINFNVSAMDARSFDERMVERGELIVEIVERALVRRRGFRMAVRGA